MNLRQRSSTIVDGPDRAPARSYLYSIGLTKEDLQKPIIGVANTWIGTMSCNFHLRRLSAKVMEWLDVDLSDEEIQKRIAEWEPPQPAYTTGVMAKYARSVSSASEGAVTS